MLDITMPHADSWNVWFVDTDNSPAGVAPLRDLVDDACRRAGRDPAAVERTVAVQVRMPGGTGRLAGDGKRTPPPLEGTPAEMAAVLRAYAHEGIGHVQLVVDPITSDSIAAFAPVLEELSKG